MLTAMDKDSFDHLAKNGDLDSFAEYTKNYVPDATLEITKEELKNLYLRTFDYNRTPNSVELNYFQPF